MKLYIKQKAFSIWDEFYVKDEYGSDKYYAEGEIFTLGKKLHIYDLADDKNEVLYLSQKPFAFMPKVDVYVNDSLSYTLVREFSLFTPVFRGEGMDFHIQGEFMAHDYEITLNGNKVATVEKEWFTWGDSYCLEVFNPENELYCLGILLGIDIINGAQAN